MDAHPQDGDLQTIGCPHALQAYVGCNDETAKELARLVYLIATDWELRQKFTDREYLPKLAYDPSPFKDLLRLLFEYDVVLCPGYMALKLLRYERPVTLREQRSFELANRYLRHEKHDTAEAPICVPDIVRAYGEFADLEVSQEILERCADFYERNDFCPLCHKKYGSS